MPNQEVTPQEEATPGTGARVSWGTLNHLFEQHFLHERYVVGRTDTGTNTYVQAPRQHVTCHEVPLRNVGTVIPGNTTNAVRNVRFNTEPWQNYQWDEYARIERPLQTTRQSGILGTAEIQTILGLEDAPTDTDEEEIPLEEEEEANLPTISSYVRENTLHVSERLYLAVRRASVPIAEALIYCGETSGKGDYLDIAADGQVSWRPLNRMEETEDNQYAVKGRMKGKPAKTIRAFIPKNRLYDITDTDWENFAINFMNQQKKKEQGFTLLSGKDVIEAYHHSRNTTLKVVRPLNASCMRHDACRPYLELYGDNPDQIRLMVDLDTEGKVAARALVWTLDSGETFMDRIYGDNYAIEDFREHARKEGWLYRARNNYEHPTLVIMNGEEKRRNRKVTLSHKPKSNQYPYLDTFLWYNTETGVLANNKPQATRGDKSPVQLRSTTGGFYPR